MVFAVPLIALLQLDPSAALLKWMDSRAQSQLTAREAKIAAIHTQAEAEARKQYVRRKVLGVIGGLPDYSGPLNARVTGRIDAGRYTIEKIVFESLPRYWVTANAYVPKTPGPHPGILIPMGHWEQGKPAAQRMAGNFALQGFVVVAFDPVGQGERQQAFDWRTGQSLAGGSTEQHILAGAQSLLVGESFARYRIWDAKRALDYLVSRPDVDGARIGCTGCSGGGTITTYISALDPRIKVAVPSCYMNSYRLLFTGPVGDSEQSPPGFLASGLDETDYVELFAPKPWMITSTEKDFFTPAAAKIVFEEAKRWYGIYGAEDKIAWVVGPGGHGTPREVREAVYGWMNRWLNPGAGSSREQEIELRPDHEFWATSTGQVSTDLKSRDLYEIIREHAEATRGGDLLGWLRKLVNHRPPTNVSRGADGEITFDAGDGMMLHAKLVVSPGATAHEATLAIRTDQNGRQPAGTGGIVMSFAPRGLPERPTSRLSAGWLADTRAGLIGENLPALRVHDILCALDVLAAQPEAGSAKITVQAHGVGGVWALIAAALDQRISSLSLDRTPHSLRAALSNPLSRDLHDAAIPGIVHIGDLPDLVHAIAPRQVVWTDPTDWMGNVVVLPGFRYSAFGN
jgi:cephalosporin-C deacetylase-like acetyl esterase